MEEIKAMISNMSTSGGGGGGSTVIAKTSRVAGATEAKAMSIDGVNWNFPEGGGSGEPDAYLKSVAYASGGDTATFTKKDNSTVAVPVANPDGTTLEKNGTSWRIKDNGVSTNKIVDGGVTTGKLSNKAVTNEKIGDSAVNTGQIASKAATTAKIADDAITNGQIADNAVQSENIKDGAVGITKINDAAKSVSIPSTGAVDTKLATEKAVKDALDNKVDKEANKSLVLDTDITQITTNKTSIGTLASLLTTAKSNIVAAINELVESISGKQNALSSDQMAAVNSTITSAKVAQIETNRTDILNKQDTLTAGNGISISADAEIACTIIDDTAKSTSTTWSSSEIKDRFDALAGKASLKIVNERPAVPVENTIYYVKRAGTTYYDIWLYAADETGTVKWVEAGSTELDLTNFYNKTEIDTKFGDYYKKTQTYSQSEVDTKLDEKQDLLTVAQQSAVDSRIDSTKVAQIETNKTSIGTLSDLTTTVKTSLVLAINEIMSKLASYVSKTDVVDNLTSTDTDKPLSANQGKVLKSLSTGKISYDSESTVTTFTIGKDANGYYINE